MPQDESKFRNLFALLAELKEGGLSGIITEEIRHVAKNLSILFCDSIRFLTVARIDLCRLVVTGLVVAVRVMLILSLGCLSLSLNVSLLMPWLFHMLGELLLLVTE